MNEFENLQEMEALIDQLEESLLSLGQENKELKELVVKLNAENERLHQYLKELGQE